MYYIIRVSDSTLIIAIAAAVGAATLITVVVVVIVVLFRRGYLQKTGNDSYRVSTWHPVAVYSCCALEIELLTLEIEFLYYILNFQLIIHFLTLRTNFLIS